MSNTQHIADRIGQTTIARALGVGATAVNNAVHRGVFPASWFPVVKSLCESAGCECPETAFNFKAPSVAPDGSLACDDQVGGASANCKTSSGRGAA